MNCEDAQSYMMAYMEKEITKEEAELLALHLASCALCRDAFEVYDTMAETLACLPDYEAPEGFEAAVLSKISALPVKRILWTWEDRVRTVLYSVFSLLFGIGSVLAFFREPIMTALGGNPFFSGYIERLTPVANAVASHTRELSVLLFSSITAVNSMVANAMGVLCLLLSIVCGMQIYLVRKRRHMSKVGRK